MKYLKFFSLIFLVFLTDVAFSQTILKRAKKYVIIDIDETYGLQANDEVNVQKKLMSGGTRNVGTLKIVLFKKGKCIGQVISENSESPIAVGDFISMEDDFSAMPTEYSSAGSTSGSGSKAFTYLSIGLGAVASGAGYYFLNQANQTYKDYEAATTSQDAADLYDKTVKLDKQSKIGFGVGGGLIAVGLISYLMNHNNPQPRYSNAFSIEPVWKKNFIGLGMNLSFNQPSRK